MNTNLNIKITYYLFFSILLNPEDKILLLDPSYCNIPAQIAYALDARIIRFNVLDKETYKYNADEKINEFYNFILKEKPKVIFLISPASGTVVLNCFAPSFMLFINLLKHPSLSFSP